MAENGTMHQADVPTEVHLRGLDGPEASPRHLAGRPEHGGAAESI